jgi:dienelactone hydrolase
MKEFRKVTITFGIIAALGILPPLAQIEPLLAQTSQPQQKPTNRSSTFRLPAPSGPYQVGTTSYYLVDSSRKEIYSTEVYALGTRKPITTPPPTDRRELMVYVWYPAKAKPGAITAPYIDEGFALVTAESMGPIFGVSPELFIKLVTQTIQTNAIPKVALANASKRYPVVIFSPGFGATPKSYTTQLEQLASYGYVVVAINPTYEVPALFPDGRVIPQSAVFDFSSADQPKIQRTFNQAVEIRAKDVSFVMNELNRLNVKDPQGLFTGRLDLSRVGIFGHSLGGDTAIEAVWRDRRLKAGINMDGGSYGKLFSSGNKDRLDRPFLVMSHDDRDDTLQSFYQRLRTNAYSLTLKGSKHITFMDFGVILPAFSANSTTQAESPIKQALGSIEPQRGAKIINTYTLAFFKKYLKNQDSPLLKGASPDYREAVLEFRRR